MASGGFGSRLRNWPLGPVNAPPFYGMVVLSTEKDLVNDEELMEVWNKMRKERVEARLIPFEPAPIAFAKRVAAIAFERGYDAGWKECAESESEVHVFNN